MSDEMVMPTPDSPAGATDSGLREAFAGFIQENADSGQEAQGAIGAVDAGLDVDNDAYLNDLLGVETPGNVPYERFREVLSLTTGAELLTNSSNLVTTAPLTSKPLWTLNNKRTKKLRLHSATNSYKTQM